MNIKEASKLLADKTHCIYRDCDNISLLKKILVLAFPNDTITEHFNHYYERDCFYGYNRIEKGNWANIGSYLSDLIQIKLSEIDESEEDNMDYITNQKELNFSLVIENTLIKIKELLIIKGKEYRRNNNPYHNFEIGSLKSGLIREKVLDGFLLKHEISISDMTNDLELGMLPTRETVEEKFNDNIIYLLLKKAMILDKIQNEKS